MYLSFDFGWYRVHFDITHKEQGNQAGGGLLNGQNLLSSVTKVISRQSLRTDTPFLGSILVFVLFVLQRLIKNKY